MKKDKNEMLYNNIKLAHADFIKELQDKLKARDSLSIKSLEKDVNDNLKRLKNE
tara:strand:- start:86 stop:247 length:162 start_codon:yes stop_codon:yes gene_type:complete